jgi:hypothetical protein
MLVELLIGSCELSHTLNRERGEPIGWAVAQEHQSTALCRIVGFSLKVEERSRSVLRRHDQ